MKLKLYQLGIYFVEQGFGERPSNVIYDRDNAAIRDIEVQDLNFDDIFNGANVVGGIAGYWFKGELENVFNTGNITVVSNDGAGTQVGGRPLLAPQPVLKLQQRSQL